MRLIVLEDGAMVADVLCGKEPLIIGAAQTCDIVLADSRVGAQNARIEADGSGGWTIEALDATQPPLLNGSLVSTRMALKVGDQIKISDAMLRVYPPAEEEAREMGLSRSQFERFAQAKLPQTATVRKSDDPLTIVPAQLHRVGQLNLALSQCIAPEPLMDISLKALLDIFGAQRAWMGLRRVNYGAMEYVEGRLITGQSTDLPEMADPFKPRVLDRGQYIVVPMYSLEDRTSIMAGPLTGPDGTLGMVWLDSGDSGRRFETKDIEYFAVVTNTIAVQLDAVFKQIAQHRAATIEGQVSVAHEIQSRLTPRKLPQWPELQFGAFREPGRESTGDVYDLLRLANGAAAFMIAHVRAAGALPSMVMAQTQAMFRSAVMHNDAPNVFLRSLNWLLADGTTDHPVGCFMGLLDPKGGQLRYASAGDVGAYVISARGEERRLGAPEPSEALSLNKAATYPLLTEDIQSDETLVLFTPGVTTAKNRKGEVFGEARFVNILCDGFGQLASASLKEMLSDLQHFTEGGQQPDDITVILAHRL